MIMLYVPILYTVLRAAPILSQKPRSWLCCGYPEVAEHRPAEAVELLMLLMAESQKIGRKAGSQKGRKEIDP